MTTHEKELHDLLDGIRNMRLQMGKPPRWKFAGIEDWLLQNGRFYVPPPTSAPKLMRPNVCYDNAYKKALRSHGKLRYVEGYATSCIPLPHAWCVDADDKVVELTWDEPGLAYFGAVFDLTDLRVVRREGGTTSMLQDNYWNNPALVEEVV